MINIQANSLFVTRKKNKALLFYKKNIINEYSKNDLIIKVKYSSLNYKDILILNANPGLVRKFPHIGGIDAVGIVYKSYSNKFKKGDKVFVIGRPLGVEIKGGYSNFIRIPDKWADHLPYNISMKKMIFFGTSGLTAANAVENILKTKNFNKNLPIFVTGSTGGVGSLSIIFLKKIGFAVEALIRKDTSKNWLKKIQINKTVKLKYLLDNYKLPLNKKNYSGAIDNLGGNAVYPILSQIDNNGFYISIGNIINDNTSISLLPLILRGVKIIGLNTETLNNSSRKKILNKYLKMISTFEVNKLSSEISFNELKDQIESKKYLKINGRIIVKF